MSLRFAFPIFLLLLGLAIQPAQARPRDEVMSSAFRCAAIADTRTWLDCYYGAAQPARAALRLTPAPTEQIRLAAAPSAGPVSAADAASRDAVMADAFRCNGLSDEHQWLNCFYAAAQPARSRLGLSSPAIALTASPKPIAPAPSFGLPRRPQTASSDRVTARMVSYAFDRYGSFTVTLENGQVWRQVSGDDVLARWNQPASRYVVRISRGALGSYNLEVRNGPGLFKVRRIA
ncbi:MAG TPA: hypothetical protein VEM35_01990 [Rhizomicrobium sp.]|nr:hypothetical protein [Rhizomicrobium sp.]